MNAYQKRRTHRLNKHRANRTDDQICKLLEIDALMKSYEDAYHELTGLITCVEYRKGWYWLHNRAMRQSDIVKQTQLILAKIYAQGLPNESN